MPLSELYHRGGGLIDTRPDQPYRSKQAGAGLRVDSFEGLPENWRQSYDISAFGREDLPRLQLCIDPALDGRYRMSVAQCAIQTAEMIKIANAALTAR
jgi:hypothetical protein